MEVIQGIIGIGPGHIGTRTADAAPFAVKRVNKQERRFSGAQKFPVLFQVMKQSLFSLNLTDEYVIAEKPLHIFL